MLVTINYILRFAIILLIKFVGKDTESAETKLIANGVFIVQFFNTAILLLLANSNLYEQNSFLGLIFNRNLPDFNSAWFNDIGYSLVYAMIFNMLWPLFEFVSFYALRLMFRILDRGFSFDLNRTTRTTI